MRSTFRLSPSRSRSYRTIDCLRVRAHLGQRRCPSIASRSACQRSWSSKVNTVRKLYASSNLFDHICSIQACVRCLPLLTLRTAPSPLQQQAQLECVGRSCALLVIVEIDKDIAPLPFPRAYSVAPLSQRLGTVVTFLARQGRGPGCRRNRPCVSTAPARRGGRKCKAQYSGRRAV